MKCDPKGLNRCLTAIALCAGLLAFLHPRGVRAHPADMYSQNQSIAITPEGVRIDWEILPGPFLADAVWTAADQDRDGIISASEAEAWGAPFAADLSVRLDAELLTGRVLQAVRWPAAVEALRTGEDRIEISLEFGWPARAEGATMTPAPHTLEIHSAHLEANSLNWFSLRADAGTSFDQPAQSNGLLRTTIHFPGEATTGTAGATSALTSWNSGVPNLPGFRFTAAVSRITTDLSQAAQPSNTARTSASSVTSALTGLVKAAQFSPLFLLSAFFLSLALGSLHALTPGHGKALVGAYLVGSRGRTRDAVLLGGIVTVTHTGSVVLLGLVTLFASHYVLPALIAPWLEIVSGLLVIGFGVNLLLRRQGDLQRLLPLHITGQRNNEPQPDLPLHSHAGHGHDHAAKSVPPDGHLHVRHEHTHAVEQDHGHEHPRPAPQVTLRSLLTLGVSGGLVPCPDAIAILLVAVAVNRIPFGILLIACFSMGLALVLIGIGVATVNGVRLMAGSDLLSRFGTYAPVLSAVVVTGLGAGLTWSAVNSLKFSAAVGQPPSSALSARTMPAFDIEKARLLYIASDDMGWDQIFMRPLSGGNAVQFTREPAGITGYSVSPDGQTILYTLFGTQGGTAIWAVDAAGTNRRLVLDCPISECNSPRWYPDGEKIAYERLDGAQNATVPRFSIWWLELATGNTQPVFQDRSLASYSPRFSPDGQWLSYVSSADNVLIIYNLKDGRSRAVPLGLQASIPQMWSPMGEALLFGNESMDGSGLRARIYALATGQTTDLGGPSGATDYAAAWSPDGNWIAVDRNIRTDASQASNQVWLVRPDGTHAHVALMEQGASYSSLNWSPDGRYLLYARYTLDPSAQKPGRFDVYVTDIRAGASRILVAGGDLPTFLP